MRPRSINGRPVVFGALLSLALAVASVPLPPASAKDKKQEKIQVQDVQLYVPDDSASTRQSKGDVDIECVTLLGDRYAFPEVFSITDADVAAIRRVWMQLRLKNDPGFDRSFKPFKTAEDWFAKDSGGRRWLNTLGSPDDKKLYGFKVKIRNNTTHVIKMSEIRVYLKLPDRDEPTAPATLGDFEAALVRLEQRFEQTRKKGFWSVDYQVGFSTLAFASKFPDWYRPLEPGRNTSNVMESEVLPGFSASGFILFAVESGHDVASVLFFEVPTTTDAAGTVVARESFEFKFKKVMTPYRWDKTVNRWVAGPPPTSN